jgi:hypothetical protein
MFGFRLRELVLKVAKINLKAMKRPTSEKTSRNPTVMSMEDLWVKSAKHINI